MKHLITVGMLLLIACMPEEAFGSDGDTDCNGALTLQATMFHFDNGGDGIPSLNGYGGTFRAHFFQSPINNTDLNLFFTYLPGVESGVRQVPDTKYFGSSINIGIIPFHRSSNKNNLHLTFGLGFLSTSNKINPEAGAEIVFPLTYSESSYYSSSRYRYVYDMEPMYHFGLGFNFLTHSQIILSSNILIHRYFFRNGGYGVERDMKIQISFGIGTFW